jgi:hypothetical protein
MWPRKLLRNIFTVNLESSLLLGCKTGLMIVVQNQMNSLGEYIQLRTSTSKNHG